MKKLPRVFFDSDVVISSIISNRGAAYVLIKDEGINRFISNISKKELNKTSRKLNISQTKLDAHTKNHFKQTELKESIKDIKKKYQIYTTDLNDAHIVKGVIESKVEFILTYNIRHFKENKIQEKLKIKTMTQGEFLQFLRSN